MGRFVFNLQKVLDHRMRIEDAKKQDFIKSRLVYMKEKDTLDVLRYKLDECISNPASYKDSYSYITRYNYMVMMEDMIKDQEKVVSVREGEMNEKKLLFESSQKDRKVMDKLKEKASAYYNLEMDRFEQKQNDEFALYGYVRK